MHLAKLFGENARNRLKALGKNQPWLAKQLGISSSAVNKYLQGNVTPGSGVLTAWATALQCEPADLLSGSTQVTFTGGFPPPPPEALEAYLAMGKAIGLEDDQLLLIQYALEAKPAQLKNTVEGIHELAEKKSQKKKQA